MLSHIQRDMIRAQARATVDGYFPITENAGLNAVIADIRQRWPEHFHNDDTLAKRVFYHQPREHVVCAGYIVPRITRSGDV